jgi:peptide/nickel transport system ATP-binding protein
VSPPPVLEVDELTIDAWEGTGWLNVVDRVSLRIGPGESLGLVGESGCGKTTVAYAALGYLRPGSVVRGGSVRFDGQDLLRLPERTLRTIRGRRVSLVPQNPGGALTPSIRVGTQVVEVLEAHGACSGREAEERAVELLAQVGLPEPEVMARRYPHELSGGQQQRVAIAMALACRPKLLVLDEPTTALDVTTQARILRLLVRLRAEHDMAMLYVTHNFGVVTQICDRVAVMYAGHLVEVASTEELFLAPLHPYTRGLLAAVPRIDTSPAGQGLRGLLRREDLPPGCRFAPRCPHAVQECFRDRQSLAPASEDHVVACWLWPTLTPESEALVGEGAER